MAIGYYLNLNDIYKQLHEVALKAVQGKFSDYSFENTAFGKNGEFLKSGNFYLRLVKKDKDKLLPLSDNDRQNCLDCFKQYMTIFSSEDDAELISIDQIDDVIDFTEPEEDPKEKDKEKEKEKENKEEDSEESSEDLISEDDSTGDNDNDKDNDKDKEGEEQEKEPIGIVIGYQMPYCLYFTENDKKSGKDYVKDLAKSTEREDGLFAWFVKAGKDLADLRITTPYGVQISPLKVLDADYARKLVNMSIIDAEELPGSIKSVADKIAPNSGIQSKVYQAKEIINYLNDQRLLRPEWRAAIEKTKMSVGVLIDKTDLNYKNIDREFIADLVTRAIGKDNPALKNMNKVKAKDVIRIIGYNGYSLPGSHSSDPKDRGKEIDPEEELEKIQQEVDEYKKMLSLSWGNIQDTAEYKNHPNTKWDLINKKEKKEFVNKTTNKIEKVNSSELLDALEEYNHIKDLYRKSLQKLQKAKINVNIDKKKKGLKESSLFICNLGDLICESLFGEESDFDEELDREESDFDDELDREEDEYDNIDDFNTDDEPENITEKFKKYIEDEIFDNEDFEYVDSNVTTPNELVKSIKTTSDTDIKQTKEYESIKNCENIFYIKLETNQKEQVNEEDEEIENKKEPNQNEDIIDDIKDRIKEFFEKNKIQQEVPEVYEFSTVLKTDTDTTKSDSDKILEALFENPDMDFIEESKIKQEIENDEKNIKTQLTKDLFSPDDLEVSIVKKDDCPENIMGRYLPQTYRKGVKSYKSKGVIIVSTNIDLKKFKKVYDKKNGVVTEENPTKSFTTISKQQLENKTIGIVVKLITSQIKKIGGDNDDIVYKIQSNNEDNKIICVMGAYDKEMDEPKSVKKANYYVFEWDEQKIAPQEDGDIDQTQPEEEKPKPEEEKPKPEEEKPEEPKSGTEDKHKKYPKDESGNLFIIPLKRLKFRADYRKDKSRHDDGASKRGKLESPIKNNGDN